MLGGIGFATFVLADLGLDPWDVFHQGVSRVSGLSLGTVVILSSLGVLALWVPLRQRPGLGTVSDVLVVGLVIDATLTFAPRPTELGTRIALLVGAIVLNGVGTSMYIAAAMGPGPRDGLMTGLASRGLSLRRARVAIDLSVLGVGWLLGGTVGVGTVAAAFGIGPIVHYLLPRLRVESTGQQSQLATSALLAHSGSGQASRGSIMKLNQVTVPVIDVTAAVGFYTRLGLKQIVGGSETYARFECPDGESTFSVHLVDEIVAPGQTTIYFECDDLDYVVAELKADGIEFMSGPTDMRWLWREARLRDPDGNQICLFYGGVNRRNPPWRLAAADPQR